MDAKTLCLGVLQLGDASGYEIKKVFEEGVLSHIYETSFGSIYPALNRLVEEGLAVCTEMAQDKRPDKKVYSITANGTEALAAALRRPPERDKVRSDFLFTLRFGHLVPQAQLQRLVEERIRWYRQTLARIEGCDDVDWPPGARLFNGLGRAVFAAAADYLDRNKQMLQPPTPETAGSTEADTPAAAALAE